MLLPSCQFALMVVELVTPGVKNLKARLAGMYFSKVTSPDIGSVGQVPAVPTTPSLVDVDRKIKLPLVVSTPLVGVYTPVTYILFVLPVPIATPPEELLILVLCTVPEPLIPWRLEPFSSTTPVPDMVPLLLRSPVMARSNAPRSRLEPDAIVSSVIETPVERTG